jgi:hypothetical protein
MLTARPHFDAPLGLFKDINPIYEFMDDVVTMVLVVQKEIATEFILVYSKCEPTHHKPQCCNDRVNTNFK